MGRFVHREKYKKWQTRSCVQHFKSEETAVTPIVSGLSLEISPNNSSQASSTVSNFAATTISESRTAGKLVEPHSHRRGPSKEILERFKRTTLEPIPTNGHSEAIVNATLFTGGSFAETPTSSEKDSEKGSYSRDEDICSLGDLVDPDWVMSPHEKLTLLEGVVKVKTGIDVFSRGGTGSKGASAGGTSRRRSSNPESLTGASAFFPYKPLPVPGVYSKAPEFKNRVMNMGSMPYGIPPPIYYPGIGYPTFNDNRAAISATAFPWATSLASTNTGAGCHGFPSVDYAQAGLRVENKAATEDRSSSAFVRPDSPAATTERERVKPINLSLKAETSQRRCRHSFTQPPSAPYMPRNSVAPTWHTSSLQPNDSQRPYCASPAAMPFGLAYPFATTSSAGEMNNYGPCWCPLCSSVKNDVGRAMYAEMCVCSCGIPACQEYRRFLP